MSQTILVVDDEPVIVEIAKKKLDNLGYDVMTAHNGEEALERVAEKRPDLILLDIEMPKMNGYTFLTELRRQEEGQEEKIPVIVLTAYNTMEPIFKRKGVRAYLLKPLQISKLLEHVKSVVGEPEKSSEA